MNTPLLIVIAGPTAVGKTELAVWLAEQLQTEILSADSRQFYKEMTIGTAKPSKEEMKGIPHHFIDSLSVGQELTAGQYEIEALQLLGRIFEEKKTALLVGGSGLFIEAVCSGIDEMPKATEGTRTQLNQEFQEKGLLPLLQELKQKDPEYFRQIDRNNHRRVIRALEVCRTTGKPYSYFRKGGKKSRPFNILKIGLWEDRQCLYDRIDQRVEQMMETGLESEAKKLLPYRQHTALNTLGYKELFRYFDGEIDKATAIELIKKNTRNFAKRQLTWLRRDDAYYWFKPEEREKLLKNIVDSLSAI